MNRMEIRGEGEQLIVMIEDQTKTKLVVRRNYIYICSLVNYIHYWF